MLVLLTDFGLEGPYLGQVRAVLATQAPGIPVVDLFADLPPFDPQSAAYLLPAYCRQPFPAGSVFLCVVDPGVGTYRDAVVVQADGYWFVGPENGLFSQIVRRAQQVRAWRIDWQPETLSASFHGRDLFAPVAAGLAAGRSLPAATEVPAWNLDRSAWAEDFAAVVYLDHYGNAMTGIRGNALPPSAILSIAGQKVQCFRTFGEAPRGGGLWYVNSNGLVEVAINGGSVARDWDVAVGDVITVDGGEGV